MSPSKKHGCSCPKCQECCRREPGWFLPEEIDIAAAYLKLGRDDFVSNYCSEHIEGDIIAISPARKPLKTECIFLNSDGLCAIHPVKPYECRKVFGCEGPSRHRRIREMISRKWR